MGSLALPPSGTVYVDAQIVIYSVEQHPRYLQPLEPLWRAADVGALTIATSELSILECLVHPIRNGDRPLQSAYNDLISRGRILFVPIDRQILRDAAAMRAATPSLRTPDSIHASTSAALGAAKFITNDRRLRAQPSIPFLILHDVLTAP